MRTSSSTTLSLPVGPRDHVQGAADAPLVLLEYGDYECPHCGRAHAVVKQVQAALGESLRFVFRNFPLTNVHPHAQRAAETAELAARHGRFWEMHDHLFEHQDRLDERHLLAAARELGLDPAALEHAWASHTFLERIKEDLRSGLESGVTGTPGFFVNGQRHAGPWDAEVLARALRGEAAG